MTRILTILTLAGAACAAQPDPNRGLYAIWAAPDPKLDGLPFLTGGQVVAQWKDVEPAPGRYDFSTIDRQFGKRAATVQINANQHPDSLFARAPYLSTKLSCRCATSAAHWPTGTRRTSNHTRRCCMPMPNICGTRPIARGCWA